MHLTQVGTLLPRAGDTLRALLAGLAELRTRQPSRARRLPHLEALNVLIQSDGLLALGSDEPHYTASRIFPKLLARRLLLALSHTASSVCSIAAGTDGVVVITHDHTRPPQSHVRQIADLLGQWLERGRAPDLPARDALLQNHLSENIARGFAAVFDRVRAGFDKPRAGERRFVA